MDAFEADRTITFFSPEFSNLQIMILPLSGADARL
jgi:hypothetical protein